MPRSMPESANCIRGFPFKLLHIVGARPQFIKLAPILAVIKRHNQENPDEKFKDILVHTGQHYDYTMSQVFFEELDLKPPDYHLGVGSGSHGQQTGEMLKRIEEVLLKEGETRHGDGLW